MHFLDHQVFQVGQGVLQVIGLAAMLASAAVEETAGLRALAQCVGLDDVDLALVDAQARCVAEVERKFRRPFPKKEPTTAEQVAAILAFEAAQTSTAPLWSTDEITAAGTGYTSVPTLVIAPVSGVPIEARLPMSDMSAAVVLAHNHPSGSMQPSRADEALTQTLKAALALVDVRVLDHIIVGPGQALSMAEAGLI